VAVSYQGLNVDPIGQGGGCFPEKVGENVGFHEKRQRKVVFF